MVKMEVVQKIDRIWEEDFREEYLNRYRKIKEFTNGQYTFRVVLDPGRDKAHKERKKANIECPFDGTEHLHRPVEGSSLRYVVNIYPYFDKHFIAFPLEHRAVTSKQDLDELIELQHHTDHLIMMNMKNAGANILDHIHYQCILEKLPIDKQKGRELTADQDLRIEQVDFPVYALRFCWDSEKGKDQAESLVLRYNKPQNLHIYRNRIYMIPRRGSYSSISPETKIGCAEVGGLFLVSSEKVFSELTYCRLESIIKDVTVSDEKEIEEIEAYIKSLVEEGAVK